MQTIKISTSQNIEIDYAVATLGDRIKARVIDYAFFMVLYMLALIGVGIYQGSGDGDRPGSSLGVGLSVIVWLVMCVFYDLLTEIFFNGQSIGKRSTQIKVISLNGARPRVGQYIIRWIFRIADFGITAGSLAVMSVALSDNKQRVGDMIAGTTLVKTEPLTRFKDLVFNEPDADYQPIYHQVAQLTDRDITLIHDVIKNFNRTRNSLLIYKLAMRIKDYLGITYPPHVNEYQFLEIVFKDYTSLIANNEV